MLSIDWSSDVFSSDLRDTVVRFLADQVEPHYEKWEKAGIFPKELYLQMGEAGLLCVDQPEEYGGIGAPFAFSCVVVEEVARMGFLALASNLTVPSDIAAPYILHLEIGRASCREGVWQYV